MKNLTAATLALTLLAACGGGDEAADAGMEADSSFVVGAPVEPAGAPAGGMTAEAPLMNAEGASVGTVTLTETGGAVQLAVQVTGMEPGTHGIHFHETGTCTPPDFTSAGSHFNPTSMQHGLENPQGPHAGDLENLEVGSDSTANVTLTSDRVILGQGANSLMDADGSAIVIHATADDQVTDPSGDSGARLACGVIATR